MTFHFQIGVVYLWWQAGPSDTVSEPGQGNAVSHEDDTTDASHWRCRLKLLMSDLDLLFKVIGHHNDMKWSAPSKFTQLHAHMHCSFIASLPRHSCRSVHPIETS